MRDIISAAVTVGSAVGLSLIVGGSSSVVITLLIEPLMKEFAWSSAVTSATATAFTVTAVCAAPGVGLLLDRWGARAVMIAGVLFTALAYVMAGQAHTRMGLLASFALLGVGYCGASYLPNSVVIALRFPNHRALGMGILMGATSVGAAGFSPLMASWIDRIGWRAGLGYLALITIMVLPLAIVAGWAMPSRTRTSVTTKGPWDDTAPGFDTARRLLVAAVIACSALFAVGMTGINYHVVTMLVDAGYSSRSAAALFSLTWLLSTVGSLVLGALGDRFGAKNVLAASLIGCGLGIAFLGNAGISITGKTSVALFILLWGGTANSVGQFMPVILSEYRGAARLGTLLGIQTCIAGITGACAPVIIGHLYDRFKGYGVAISICAGATLAAALLAAAVARSSHTVAVAVR